MNGRSERQGLPSSALLALCSPPPDWIGTAFAALVDLCFFHGCRDAMQIAARNGCIAMLRLLFEHGGALFSRGPKGETLFHLAAYNGHVKTMAWLHERGILPEAVDMYGQTAVHTAARRGELHVLKYLHEDLGLDVCTAEDFDGRTPLECIPRRGQEELQFCREYLQSLLGVTMSSSGLQLRALPPSET